MLKHILKIASKYLLIKKIGLFEFIRLKKLKKFQPTYTYLDDIKIHLVDASTYLSLINEIFVDEIYRFDSKNANPVIFDCGANIGLATIYFKKVFPDSIIYSYEPDPVIFETLNYNITSNKYCNVNLINKAISIKDGTCEFVADGSLSGMISLDSNLNLIQVETIRLKTILSKFEKIDFLKIDIEGHEDLVIEDIKEELAKVENLFLEYHSFIGKPQNLDRLLRIISDAGFRYYFKESDFKKNPFIDRVLFHDIDTVVNIFCYK